jgi:hypothetical protein
MTLKSYLVNLLAVWSNVLNVLFGGMPNESLCGRAHRNKWVIIEKWFNAFFRLFGLKDHCRVSHILDRVNCRIVIEQTEEY